MSNARIRRDLPNDEYQAAVGANNASASNVFATIADLTSGVASADKIIFDAKYDEAGGILKGQAVYISGADGTNILVKKADYSTEATSSKTLGLATEPGALNHQGQVISDGLLSNIDTSAAGAVGDPVWLGDDGNLLYGLVNKPYAPNHLVFIGIVTKKNPSTGEIFVKIQNGFELDEIHNVDVKSSLPTNGQVLTYDSVTGLWRNANVPSDVNIYNSNGTVTGTRTVDLNGNTINFDNGNVGINVTPSAPLHVMGTAIPSTNENLAYFQVTDGAGAYFAISNGSTADGSFQPKIFGRQASSSNATAVTYAGVIDSTQDSGTTPVVGFQAHLHTLAAVVTRPLFQFRNWATNIMTILANGNVGIGTTTPGEKLEVSGKTKTTTFQMTTSPTAGYVLTSDASGNGTWSPASSGGLTYFTEAENTSTPNGTVYVDSLTAAASSTNADAVIRPKGNGAFILAIPDNTTTGGNKRGQYAVDLSLGTRVSASSVASGNYSFAAGSSPYANSDYAIAISATASNTRATALNQGSSSGIRSFSHGDRASASGTGSVAFNGNNGGDSIASGDYSFSFGVVSTASGNRSVALGGTGNVASGLMSYAMGDNSNTFGIYGRHSRGVYNSATGDCQKSEFFLSVRTTGNTATTVTVNGGTASSTNQVILSNQSAYRFKGTIIGKQSGSTNVAAWDVDGLIVRGANAAATTLVVSNVNVVDNTPTFGTPTLAADTTNGGLRVQVTGVAATNIQWTATIETTEVIYA